MAMIQVDLPATPHFIAAATIDRMRNSVPKKGIRDLGFSSVEDPRYGSAMYGSRTRANASANKGKRGQKKSRHDGIRNKRVPVPYVSE
jgi:hypothetical protein